MYPIVDFFERVIFIILPFNDFLLHTFPVVKRASIFFILFLIQCVLGSWSVNLVNDHFLLEYYAVWRISLALGR